MPTNNTEDKTHWAPLSSKPKQLQISWKYFWRKKCLNWVSSQQRMQILMYSIQVHNDMLLQAAILPIHDSRRGGRPDDPGEDPVPQLGHRCTP